MQGEQEWLIREVVLQWVIRKGVVANQKGCRSSLERVQTRLIRESVVAHWRGCSGSQREYVVAHQSGCSCSLQRVQWRIREVVVAHQRERRQGSLERVQWLIREGVVAHERGCSGSFEMVKTRLIRKSIVAHQRGCRPGSLERVQWLIRRNHDHSFAIGFTYRLICLRIVTSS